MESECCYAPPIDEVDQNDLGICSACKEHAVFYTSEELDKQEKAELL